MSRLDEIKARLENMFHTSATERYEAKVKLEAHAESDIDFLIDEVERLKGVLQRVYEINGYMFVKEALKDETK